MACEKIWNKFNKKNMGDYYDHYLKKDVLLLADVFERFIITRLKYYELDSCHYFSSPGLSWDAMVKMTDVKLEKYQTLTCTYLSKKEQDEVFLTLLKDTNNKYKANNKYMSDYNSEEPSTFITYLDENNLYGWAMSECLPYGEFRWVKNVDGLHVNVVNEKSVQDIF